jgi:hypothetical protein
LSCCSLIAHSETSAEKGKKENALIQAFDKAADEVRASTELLNKRMEEYKKTPEGQREAKKNELLETILDGMSDKDIKFIAQDNPNPSNPLIGFRLRYGKQLDCTAEEVKKIRSEMGDNKFYDYGDKMDLGASLEFVDYSKKYIKRFRSYVLSSEKISDKAEIMNIVDSIEEDLNKTVPEMEPDVTKKWLPELAKAMKASESLAKETALNFSRKYKGCLGYPVSMKYSKLYRSEIKGMK